MNGPLWVRESRVRKCGWLASTSWVSHVNIHLGTRFHGQPPALLFMWRIFAKMALENLCWWKVFLPRYIWFTCKGLTMMNKAWISLFRWLNQPILPTLQMCKIFPSLVVNRRWMVMESPSAKWGRSIVSSEWYSEFASTYHNYMSHYNFQIIQFVSKYEKSHPLFSILNFQKIGSTGKCHFFFGKHWGSQDSLLAFHPWVSFAGFAVPAASIPSIPPFMKRRRSWPEKHEVMKIGLRKENG